MYVKYIHWQSICRQPCPSDQSTCVGRYLLDDSSIVYIITYYITHITSMVMMETWRVLQRKSEKNHKPRGQLAHVLCIQRLHQSVLFTRVRVWLRNSSKYTRSLYITNTIQHTWHSIVYPENVGGPLST